MLGFLRVPGRQVRKRMVIVRLAWHKMRCGGLRLSLTIGARALNSSMLISFILKEVSSQSRQVAASAVA